MLDPAVKLPWPVYAHTESILLYLYLYTDVAHVTFIEDVPNILENIARLKTDLTNIIEPDFGLSLIHI